MLARRVYGPDNTMRRARGNPRGRIGKRRARRGDIILNLVDFRLPFVTWDFLGEPATGLHLGVVSVEICSHPGEPRQRSIGETTPPYTYTDNDTVMVDDPDDADTPMVDVDCIWPPSPKLQGFVALSPSNGPNSAYAVATGLHAVHFVAWANSPGSGLRLKEAEGLVLHEGNR